MFSTKGYEFKQESFAEYAEAIVPMLKDYKEEVGEYEQEFNPDLERYAFLEQEGLLAFFVAWHGDELAGFATFFLDTEIQQKEVRSATQSMNFVGKKHRGIGYPFMKFCDDILQKQGVNSIWRQATVKFDIGKVYQRMGYHLAEKAYLRRFPNGKK